MFQVGDHNGTYSSCWGYATHVDGYCTINHLPSCETCRARRKEQLRRISGEVNTIGLTEVLPTSCQRCSDWSLEDPKFTFLAPQDYPRRYDSRTNAPHPPKHRDLWVRIEQIPSDDASPEEEVELLNDSVQANNIQNPDKKRRKKNKKPKMKYQIYLRSVKLTVSWLKIAVDFACHNVKTFIPGQRQSQRYWTKGNFVSFLKTCGLTSKVIDSLYNETRSMETQTGEQTSVTYPVAWKDVESLSKCHYAPMHMLFLGHAKSNWDMMSKWLGKFNKLATFGRQANKFLYSI